MNFYYQRIEDLQILVKEKRESLREFLENGTEIKNHLLMKK